ncbi:MAG TPA: protein kinase [Polyangiaceae bacterium]|nr:protein kinase [Polyangiaceae bacterium]
MTTPPERQVGRYTLFEQLASGGFARVHLGRLNGDAGFARTVAIKRLHEGQAADPDAVRLLLDEARLAARVRHPNVVQTLDVLVADGELLLVMDYVHGETLARLLTAARRRGAGVPPPVLGAVMSNALSGLHAAHETVDEAGRPLNIVHRDVSPQNIMVGADGVARVLDFGIAKASGIEARTREGQFRGKLSYAAPEQLEARPIDRAADVYGAGVVLWEALAGRRLFLGSTEPEIIMKVALGQIEPLRSVNPTVPPEVEAVVMRALARDPASRYPTALAMAHAVEQALGVAPARDVGAWVAAEAAEALARCAALVAQVERGGPASGAMAVVPGRPSAGRPSASLLLTPGGRPAGRSSAPPAGASGEWWQVGSGPDEGVGASGSTERVYTKSTYPALPARPSRQPRLVLAAFGLVVAAAAVAVTLSWRAKPLVVVSPAASGPSVPGEGAARPPSGPAATATTGEPPALASAPAGGAPGGQATAPGPAGGASGGQATPPGPADAPPGGQATPPKAGAQPAGAAVGRTHTTAPPSRPPRPEPGAAPNCNPPYTVDASGRRRFKPECL